MRVAPAMRSAWITLRPTPPDPEDGGRLARRHLGPVQHRAHSGQHPAADEAGRGERHVLGDADRLDLAARWCTRRTPRRRRSSRRAPLVGERRDMLPSELRHHGGVAGAAGPAGAAAGQGGDHDVVAGLDRAHRRARPASTTPAPSWPSTDGAGNGMVPSMTDRSEWHTPAATIRTLTSLGPGSRDLQLVGDLYPVTGVHDPSHQCSSRCSRLRSCPLRR